MAEQTIYRCINEACARTMPRPVEFCPYCGTAQTAAARAQQGERTRPQPAATGATGAAAAAAPAAAVAGAVPAAPLPGWSDAPDVAAVHPPAAPPPPPSPPTSPPPGPTQAVPPAAGAAHAQQAPPSATAFGHGARTDTAGPTTAKPERARGIPWPPKPAPAPGPGGRTPVRLRWWILFLAILWGVWLVAKPSGKKVERRIDAAIALAQACQSKQAQDELIALRAGRATPEQLARLQRGLNEASTACTRKRQREKAWNDASGAVESLLAAGSYERARTRLQAFTRRWGEDKETRALKARIEEGRHPLAAPESSSHADTAVPAQSARNLVQEARADLARGDAAAARDKMDLCLAMVDPSDRDCAAVKSQAERVLRTE